MAKKVILLMLICFSIKLYAQWTSCPIPSGISPFSLGIANDTLYLGTISSGIYRSSDGGASWTQVNNGITNMQIWAINKVDNAVFASSTGGKVFKSTNGGNNWVLSNTGISATTIVNKFVYFNGKVFAVTTNTGIIVSNDNGMSWVSHNTGITGLVAGTITVIENDLYVGVNQKVYKYNATNQSWIVKSNGIPNQTVGALTYIKDNQQNTILFEGNGNSNEVAKSTNGGDNWSLSNNGLPSVGVSSLLGIGTVVFAGNDYGVYQTNNQGVNWFDISGFNLASPAKFLTQSSTNLYVLQGAKLWKISLANLGITGINDVFESDALVICANPSDKSILIKSKFQLVSYEIINLNGQKLVSGKLTNTTIDVKNLNKGYYLLTLTANSHKKITRKVLIS